MKSILQKSRQCWVCGNPNVVEHHVFFGGKRSLSEKYGLKVYLCGKHHNASNEGVHFNTVLDEMLKKFAQQKFEEVYSHEMFMEVFRKNYL